MPVIENLVSVHASFCVICGNDVSKMELSSFFIHQDVYHDLFVRS